jgi:hypothetical protein
MTKKVHPLNATRLSQTLKLFNEPTNAENLSPSTSPRASASSLIIEENRKLIAQLIQRLKVVTRETRTAMNTNEWRRM